MNRRDTLTTLLFVTLLAAAIIGLRTWTSGVAPVPAVFDRTVTLADASAQASAEKKVVFAFATADWCGPCQSIKRGALQDARVAEWLTAHTVPVYIDLTNPAPEGDHLAVRAVPAMILLDGDRELARAEGVLGPTELLQWLETHTPRP